MACHDDPNEPDLRLTCHTLHLANLYCHFPECPDPAVQFNVTATGFESDVSGARSREVGTILNMRCSADGKLLEICAGKITQLKSCFDKEI